MCFSITLLSFCKLNTCLCFLSANINAFIIAQCNNQEQNANITSKTDTFAQNRLQTSGVLGKNVSFYPVPPNKNRCCPAKIALGKSAESLVAHSSGQCPELLTSSLFLHHQMAHIENQRVTYFYRVTLGDANEKAQLSSHPTKTAKSPCARNSVHKRSQSVDSPFRFPHFHSPYVHRPFTRRRLHLTTYVHPL